MRALGSEDKLMQVFVAIYTPFVTVAAKFYADNTNTQC
jgi:hypothetical protein